jgi:hypothetical protein
MSNDNNVVPFGAPKVTPKVTPSDQNIPNPAIVELLEGYLERARDGKIQFVAIAIIDETGIASSSWDPGDESSPQLVTQALGAVAYLHHRFNASVEAGSVFLDD